MWYNINIKKLAILHLPTVLRKAREIKFLLSLVKPLSRIHYDWLLLRNENIYKLNHNSQVCYLRKTLNDRFDPVERRILISDSQIYKQNYIYTVGENKPYKLGNSSSTDCGPMYLRQASDYNLTSINFVVKVPNELLIDNINKIKAIIDYYKLANKKYKIEKL